MSWLDNFFPGLQGPAGPQGAAGPPGATGPAGATGATGPGYTLSTDWTTAVTQLELDDADGKVYAVVGRGLTTAGVFLTILDLLPPTNGVDGWDVSIMGVQSGSPANWIRASFQTFVAQSVSGVTTLSPTSPTTTTLVTAGNGASCVVQVIKSSQHVQVQVKDDGTHPFKFKGIAQVMRVNS